ncbi:unnamed protein product [Phyllotreta striolata]|uniref:HIG1 domain-containing protein n=1 Tax=Phyllotreta striolata TaxID=444603 RepID=A0A9P0GU32_PHYSR|nr:unnamed protein product [Phyllotreta striolata]
MAQLSNILLYQILTVTVISLASSALNTTSIKTNNGSNTTVAAKIHNQTANIINGTHKGREGVITLDSHDKNKTTSIVVKPLVAPSTNPSIVNKTSKPAMPFNKTNTSNTHKAAVVPVTIKPKKPTYTEHDEGVPAMVKSDAVLHSPNTDHIIDPKMDKKVRRADYIVPIVAVILSVPLVAIILSVLYKRGKDWWQHRNYRRMDFLIEAMAEPSRIFYEEESHSSRLARKSRETPFFPIAIGVCSAAVAYGAYAFKNRGSMSTSVYLMHLRVGAQGAAVASLTLGLLYTMINRELNKKE